MTAKYGYKKQLENGMAFDEAISRTTEALKAEGFGVLCDINVRAKLQEKLNEDIGYEYRILGACHPKLAKEAIEHEPMIGLLLPCNMLVEKRGEEVFVSAINAREMFTLIERPEMEKIAADVDDRLQRVMEKI